ncbi:MAG: VWA domain-containing protein, partial [Saprospiraceae bacterium]|nr:VWA domain-containing protein [Saprospiraceae bacterium]
MTDRIQKWRLILGKPADPARKVELSGKEAELDRAVEALYDSNRKGGLGDSAPNVNRWLGDIRRYFPKPVVQIMQKDALERLGLYQMLSEPELLEELEPSVELIATLLSLKHVIPDQTKETARLVVRKLVEQLQRELENPMRQAISGALDRSAVNRRPRLREVDWHRTIRANLRHYQPDRKLLIPEVVLGYGRKERSLKHVILLVDQSASMAESLVYAGVLGAVLASLPSIQTHFLVFDTQVADLTEQVTDPVDLLFGLQLGGGTDIDRALALAQKRVERPTETVLVLISDLFEGGDAGSMLARMASLQALGVTIVSLLALDDRGAPAFDQGLATQLASMGIPAFACSPDRFPSLMGAT